MDLRKSTSERSKAVRVPGDARDMIERTISEEYSDKLSGIQLSVDGYIFKEEFFLRVSLIQSGSLRPHNFEFSCDFTWGKDQAMDLIYTAIDAIGSMLSDHFEHGDDIAFPNTWTKYGTEVREIYLQTSKVHPELEDEASRLLGEEVTPGKDLDEEKYTAILEQFKKALKKEAPQETPTIH